MTFEVYDGTGGFHCDTCPEYIACEGRSDFTGCLILAKAAGWRTYKGPDKEWAHACPACVEDYVKERGR